MPNVVAMKNRKTGEVEKFQTVDDKIREFLGMGPSATEWAYNWYNCFAEGWAFGRTIEDQKKVWCSDGDDVSGMRHKILCWIEENYTIEAWYEMK